MADGLKSWSFRKSQGQSLAPSRCPSSPSSDPEAPGRTCKAKASKWRLPRRSKLPKSNVLIGLSAPFRHLQPQSLVANKKPSEKESVEGGVSGFGLQPGHWSTKVLSSGHLSTTWHCSTVAAGHALKRPDSHLRVGPCGTFYIAIFLVVSARGTRLGSCQGTLSIKMPALGSFQPRASTSPKHRFVFRGYPGSVSLCCRFEASKHKTSCQRPSHLRPVSPRASSISRKSCAIRPRG